MQWQFRKCKVLNGNLDFSHDLQHGWYFFRKRLWDKTLPTSLFPHYSLAPPVVLKQQFLDIISSEAPGNLGFGYLGGQPARMSTIKGHLQYIVPFSCSQHSYFCVGHHLHPLSVYIVLNSWPFAGSWSGLVIWASPRRMPLLATVIGAAMGCGLMSHKN